MFVAGKASKTVFHKTSLLLVLGTVLKKNQESKSASIDDKPLFPRRTAKQIAKAEQMRLMKASDPRNQDLCGCLCC
jgi:hypothetical protein